MRLTNKFGLPETFVRFESKNTYTKGDADLSVTEVIDSPRISKLRKENADDVEEDISDRIMSILGTAVHNILEIGAPPNAVVEERLYMTVDGSKVGGQIDLQEINEDGGVTLSDYKTCSAYKLQASPEGDSSWVRQLNLYRLLAEANGRIVDNLQVIAIVRDWSSAKAERSADYPAHPVVIVPIPMWDPEDAEKYLKDRVFSHVDTGIGANYECTPEERWERPTRYAVHEMTQKGSVRKRATKLFDSLIDAESFLYNEAFGKGEVQVRMGESVRCKNFCSVSQFCNQYKEIQEKSNEQES